MEIYWVFFNSGLSLPPALPGEESRQQLSISLLSRWSFNSVRVLIGVLMASHTSHLLAGSLSLWGRPATGRFTHGPCCFHFLMMDLTDLWGMFSELEMFLYPSPDLYFSITFSQRCVECFLSSWCYCSHEYWLTVTGPSDTGVFVLQYLETHSLHSLIVRLLAPTRWPRLN